MDRLGYDSIMGDRFNPLGAQLAEVPIVTSKEDKFGRAPIARSFADSIRSSNTKYGLVVGVMAPWGHGKSSFINLMRERFEEDPGLTVIDFNPWMFSGSDQLIQFFLNQLAAELKFRDKNKYSGIANQIADYAGVLSPTFDLLGVPLASRLIDTAEKGLRLYADIEQDATSVNRLRQRITDALMELENPIVVVIDDIDRLGSLEIRQIFQLVRLTASFPNVIYLLAFDRNRVEHALSDDAVSGRTYLEKIVQISYDVPEVPEQLLTPQILEILNILAESNPNIQLDEDRWSLVFWDVIRPLFSNMRDLIRFKVSAEPTIRALSSEIDLVDLFAIEALRIFRPNKFAEILNNRQVLTETASSYEGKDSKYQRVVRSMVSFGSEDETLMLALIQNVFPAATKYVSNGNCGEEALAQWRISHRIAHIDFLSAYLDGVAPRELVSFRSAERAFEYFNSEFDLKVYLDSLDPSELTETIGNLASFEAKFTREMVIPASSTLLNIIDKMPDKPTGFLLTSGRREIIVARVVVRLFKVIEDQVEKMEFAAKILNRIETYSSMLYFINLIGDRENIGQNLISPEETARLREKFVDLADVTPSNHPSREWDAWRIYDEVQNRHNGFILTSSDDPVLLRSVLCSLSSDVRRQSFDSYQIEIEKRLHWDLLIRIFGSESSISEVIQVLRKEFGDTELTKLANEYLTGSKPESF